MIFFRRLHEKLDYIIFDIENLKGQIMTTFADLDTEITTLTDTINEAIAELTAAHANNDSAAIAAAIAKLKAANDALAAVEIPATPGA
jgi:hypothetical protein